MPKFRFQGIGMYRKKGNNTFCSVTFIYIANYIRYNISASNGQGDHIVMSRSINGIVRNHGDS